MTATQQNKPRAGRPANANPELQREKIIRAALAEFSQRGFAGTSVRTIAQQAGITHGLIRHYFQCKEELFHSAADYLFGEMAQVLAQAAERSSPDDPVGQLVLQIRSFVQLSAQLPDMAGFLMQAGLDGGDHFHYVIEKHVRPLQELSLIAYRRAVAEGLMRNINPDFVFLIATHAATAPFANPALRHVLGDASASDADQVEDYADTLISILLDGALTEKYRAESR
jgi:TetR/AcrR family transcriptional regulator